MVQKEACFREDGEEAGGRGRFLSNLQADQGRGQQQRKKAAKIFLTDDQRRLNISTSSEHGACGCSEKSDDVRNEEDGHGFDKDGLCMDGSSLDLYIIISSTLSLFWGTFSFTSWFLPAIFEITLCI